MTDIDNGVAGNRGNAAREREAAAREHGNVAMSAPFDGELSEPAPEFEHMAVMCLGNLLLRDEGLGPTAAKYLLDNYEFPECVDVLDCGVMGYGLMPEFMTYDYILTVDAVQGTGEQPGTVFTFTPEEMADPQGFRGAHDTSFADVIGAAKMIGYNPVGECIGVQVADIGTDEPCIGLTPMVEAALPLVCETVFATLWRHGVRGIVDRRTGEKVAPR